MWTLLPVGNGEGMQVLRYHKSQHYDAVSGASLCCHCPCACSSVPARPNISAADALLPHPPQHWDYFFHKEGVANGGNRYATVLMYLEDTEEGGETVFPNIPAPGGVNEGFSECAKYHLAAKPKKGSGKRRPACVRSCWPGAPLCDHA